MKITVSTLMLCALVIPMAIAVRAAWAHDENPRDQSTAHPVAPHDASFGRPGVTKDVTRAVFIHMSDAMRFTPDSLAFKQGETVRLRIINDGKLPHEFVFGTQREIDEHAQMMLRMPTMMHTDASSVRVAPGMSADIVWKFSQPGKFLYACLVPGHKEAGMHGIVMVVCSVKR
jgi:uncharacterized cupredoxin-like copper-binding protein